MHSETPPSTGAQALRHGANVALGLSVGLFALFFLLFLLPWLALILLSGCQLHANRTSSTSSAPPATAATAANAPTIAAPTTQSATASPAPLTSPAAQPAVTELPPAAAPDAAAVKTVLPGAVIFTRDTLLKGADLAGVEHTLGATPGCKAIAVVVIGTTCPISNKFIPELNRLAEAAKDQQIEFYGLLAAAPPAGVTRAEAVKHSADYKLAFPVLYDTSGELFDRLTPTHTPNALVITPAGVLAYRGRIDDRFYTLGRERETITCHDLQDALAAVAAGKPVATPVTEPVGCVVEGRAAATASATTAVTITYNREIAPIIQNNCAVCHHAGEVAPFALTNYRETVKHAEQIVTVTGARIMPPWKPEPGYGHFKGERRLSDREIALLAAWAKGNTPEGDPADLPPPPTFTTDWPLGKPDLILKMPQAYTLPAQGHDVYRCFAIPINLPEDQYVSAVDFHPGNARVVHHAIFYIDKSGAAQKKDDADPLPGYTSFGGPGFLPAGSLGGWAPGARAEFFPDGVARELPKGSTLAMQMHYNLSGKAETDQSEIALYFAKKKPDHLVTGLPLLNRGIYLPAGEKRHKETVHFELPVDVTAIGVFPHMHLLGREIKLTATLPDGTVQPLIWIKDWDFNWQGQYLFDTPIRLPKGTKLDVEAYFDNSADNERNPHNPPVDVRWGEQTTDEMLFCPLVLTTDNDQDLRKLRFSMFKQLLVRTTF